MPKCLRPLRPDDLMIQTASTVGSTTVVLSTVSSSIVILSTVSSSISNKNNLKFL